MKEQIISILGQYWPFASASIEEISKKAKDLLTNYPRFFNQEMSREDIRKQVEVLLAEE